LKRKTRSLPSYSFPFPFSLSPDSFLFFSFQYPPLKIKPVIPPCYRRPISFSVATAHVVEVFSLWTSASPSPGRAPSSSSLFPFPLPEITSPRARKRVHCYAALATSSRGVPGLACSDPFSFLKGCLSLFSFLSFLSHEVQPRMVFFPSFVGAESPSYVPLSLSRAGVFPPFQTFVL